jgi:osmoprotectant transport system substrate-binding protein
MGKQGTSIVWLLVLMLLLVSCGQPNRASEAGPDGITVRISSSDYGEVEILAEMVKALIENETDHKVERILNMTDFISFAAMGQGDLDMYTTFTGTQFMGTLEQELTPEWRDPDKVWQYVHERLLDEYGYYTFEPYGYNNVYGLAVSKVTAGKLKLKTISDIVPYAAEMVLATDQTFQDRPGQGYKEFCETYGFKFKNAVAMEMGLMYRALATKEADAAVVYTTDGRNSGQDLVVLEDDKQFNPPYYGMLIARADLLEQYPEIKEAVTPLSGLLDTKTQTELNAKVDVDGDDPAQVARNFLQGQGLL